jgi:predicted RNA-binding protein with PUA-like domain
MNYWLMKSEPETFSIQDLQQCNGQTHCWDGVRNYQARNFMRDAMQHGDLAFFYHSSCKIPGIVGIIAIASDAYPDHTAFDPESKYYDLKSTPEKPRWIMRDVKLVEVFKRIITLDALRQNEKLQDLRILKPGNRLSITPVTKEQWQAICAMSQ